MQKPEVEFENAETRKSEVGSLKMQKPEKELSKCKLQKNAENVANEGGGGVPENAETRNQKPENAEKD